MTPPMSIKRRLLLWLLGPLLAISTVFVGATYAIERVGIDHYQDRRLRRIALDIPTTLKTGDLRQINVKLFHGRDDFLLQIWQGDREIYRSAVDLALPRFDQPGFGIRTARGGAWKLYVRRMGPYTIQVAQSVEERNALARERAFHLIVPLLLLIAAIALCTPLAVTAGLRSLRRISRELESRDLDRLEPLDPAHEPAEIRPVVEAIDHLLARLARAADAQQQFLADASHELRTPLAGLQLQVRMVERAGDEPARRAALAVLDASVRRAGRLVEQLLTTSRLDADAARAAGESVALNGLVRDALVRLEPLAEAKAIDIGLARDDPATIAGSGDEILVLLLNLIDNAIRYTPAGGRVDVSIARRDGRIAFVVEDSGPGIAPADRVRAFDRFFRAPGHETVGSGLGLAIVKRIADRHDAQVILGDSRALGGLAATASFPAHG